MGELKEVLAPALSSTNRAKSRWRGRKLKSRTPAVDAFACDEVRRLLACLTYQVMHIARHALAGATGTVWSLGRLRERVLRAGARLVISGRRMVLALSSSAAPFWVALWPRLMALHWLIPIHSAPQGYRQRPRAMCRHAPRTPDDTVAAPPAFEIALPAALGRALGRRSSHCQQRGSSEASKTARKPRQNGMR